MVSIVVKSHPAGVCPQTSGTNWKEGNTCCRRFPAAAGGAEVNPGERGSRSSALRSRLRSMGHQGTPLPAATSPQTVAPPLVATERKPVYSAAPPFAVFHSTAMGFKGPPGLACLISLAASQLRGSPCLTLAYQAKAHYPNEPRKPEA